MTAYDIPDGIPHSTLFTVKIDGKPIDVASTAAADFVTVAVDGSFVVEVSVPDKINKVQVRPLRMGIEPILEGETVRLTFTGPGNASIEIDGLKPLFLFANPPQLHRPDPRDPAVRYYGGGIVHDVGVIELHSGETLYIEGGTVLRGALHAVDATKIRIAGHGILDGSYDSAINRRQMIVLENCRDSIIENLVLIRPTSWMVVLGDCDAITVRNLKEIGEVVCSDGIDVVGSRDVLIEDCFLSNNDDCVVIKSTSLRGAEKRGLRNWRKDVARVTTRRCTLLNFGSGNTMEIGFELCTDVVEDVVFEDIDVIGAHQYAAVFSIHNGDRAIVRNIRYENIRVEHYWNKLVDFRVLHSRYSRDKERGQIQNVLLKNIRCIPNTYNTPSLIGGHDATHTVDHVVFEDFFIGEDKVLNGDDLHLFTKQASGIVFR